MVLRVISDELWAVLEPLLNASVLQGGKGRGRARCCSGRSGPLIMPHKANAGRRHHIPRPKRRVTNWAEYDAALRRRGSLTVWFTEEAITCWTIVHKAPWASLPSSCVPRFEIEAGWRMSAR